MNFFSLLFLESTIKIVVEIITTLIKIIIALDHILRKQTPHINIKFNFNSFVETKIKTKQQ